MQDVRLLVAVASGRGWASGFGQCMAGLMLNLGLNRLGGRMETMRLAVTQQAYLVAARQDHLNMAIKEDFTHYLSLDDDQTFPGDIVERMLAHQKPVVTCNYRKKREPLEHVCGDLRGNILDSTGKTGLEEIGSMGMGMTLVDVSAVKHIPAPHFGVIWNADKNEFLIEDAIFSLVLRDNGVPIWCDHDLSRQIGHIGEIEYRLPPLKGIK